MSRHRDGRIDAVPARRSRRDKLRSAQHAEYLRCVRQARAVRSVRPVSRRSLAAGAVAWACVPYAECREFKTRPVLILGVEEQTVVCLPFSRLKPGRHLVRLPEDVSVLAYPSGLLPRVVRLDLDDVRMLLGSVSEPNLAAAHLVAMTAAALSRSGYPSLRAVQ